MSTFIIWFIIFFKHNCIFLFDQYLIWGQFNVFTESALGWFFLVVAVSVRILCLVPFPWIFLGRSLALRSHNQFKAPADAFYKSKCLSVYIFVWKRSKIATQKKSLFLADFALQNMVETTLPDGLETSGRRAYRKFWHISRQLSFWVLWFFPFLKEIGFLGILGPPGNHASQWMRKLWSKGVLLILAYFYTFLSFCILDVFSV